MKPTLPYCPEHRLEHRGVWLGDAWMGVGLAKNARPKGRAAGEGLLNLVLHRALANALLAADIDLQSEPEIASTRLMGMSTSQEFDLLGRY